MRPATEALEGRALLVGSLGYVEVDAVALGSPAWSAVQVTNGPDGNLWFTENRGASSSQVATGAPSAIGTINLATRALREFPLAAAGIPTGTAKAIAPGPDGKLWFTDPATGSVGSINPASGAIVEYPVGVAGSAPSQLVAGPDGRIWFTDPGAGAIGAIDPATKQIREYPLAAKGFDPEAIVAAPDGGLWFIEVNTARLGRIDPATLAITETARLPITNLPFGPYQGIPTGSLIVGPDGNLWLTAITYTGRFLQHNDSFVTYNTTTGVTQVFGDSGISLANGPDGNVWSGLAAIDPRTFDSAPYSLLGTEVPAISNVYFPGIGREILASDGNLWYADAGQVDRIRVAPIPGDQGWISGGVLVDSGGDGNAAGEPGAANRQVYLDLNGNATLDAGEPVTLTDATGGYLFRGVAPGTTPTLRIVTLPGEVVDNATGGINGMSVAVVAGRIAAASRFFLTVTGSVLPLSTAPGAFGDANPDISTAEVVGLYRTILGRAPDATGGANAVAALKTARLTPKGLASVLFHSDEYAARVATRQYTTYLGRSPSTAEVATVTSALHAGLTPEGLATALMSSPEFARDRARDDDFTRSVYLDVLGRYASTAEVATVTSALSRGLSRTDLIGSLLHSAEAEARSVNGLYVAFLGRAAEPAGSTFWVGGLQAGTPLLDVAIQFASGPEFIGRANATVRA